MNRAVPLPRTAVLMFALAMLPAQVVAEHSPGHARPRAGDGASLVPLEALGLLVPEVPEFLTPDIAFVPSIALQDARTVTVRWTIANGYYLYRDMFRFAVAAPVGVRIDTVTLPAGTFAEDPYFGRQQVYYGALEAVIGLARDDSTASMLSLDVGYQGCADAGLCYPPMRRTLSVELRAAERR